MAPPERPPTVPAVERADCCVVGGGPAGAVLALLLARQGVAVTLLEAHGDFDRDFRGDALQPAALDLLGQLGLADRLLAVALARTPAFPVRTPAETVPFHDVSRLETPYPFMTLVPQVRLLDLVVDEARRCPTFRLVMGARVEALVQDGAGPTGTSAGCATGPGTAGTRSGRCWWWAPTGASPGCGAWPGWSRCAPRRRSTSSGSGCPGRRPIPRRGSTSATAARWRC